MTQVSIIPLKSVISRLEEAGLSTVRFLRVRTIGERPKAAQDPNWQNTLHPLDGVIRQQLFDGLNYGVCAGNGLVIVDIDNYNTVAQLPETFEIETGRKGRHLYFASDDIRFNGIGKKEGVTEQINIQVDEKYVVGPGSVHENGNVYTIIKDLPIAKITRAEVEAAFPGYTVTWAEKVDAINTFNDVENTKIPTPLEISKRSSLMVSLGITGLTWNGIEYEGPHPIHGSENGKNFHFDEANRRWKCFRCNSGGSVLQFIAMKEGLLKCEQCLPGCLNDKELFLKVLNIAKEKYHYNPDDEYKTEMSLVDLNKILDLTIKGDDLIKDFLFPSLLLTYTKKRQLNFIITGGTTIGKSYITNELIWFFPKEDVWRLVGASPTALINNPRAQLIDRRTMQPIILKEPEKEATQEAIKEYQAAISNLARFIDYSKMIILFPDMPDVALLEKLRPLMSHDEPIAEFNITNPKRHRAETTFLKGYWTSVFCTTNPTMDEQEASRNIILSPEWTELKASEAEHLICTMASDSNYENWRNTEESRVWLKKRVELIKWAQIDHIMIPRNIANDLEDWFNARAGKAPTNLRHLPQLLGLTCSFALLNCFNRRSERVNGELYLYANEKDAGYAKFLYKKILRANEYGISNESLEVYEEVIKPILTDSGITIQDIEKRYRTVKKYTISQFRLKGMMMSFERNGLLSSEHQKGKATLYFDLTEDQKKSKPLEQESEEDHSLDGWVTNE